MVSSRGVINAGYVPNLAYFDVDEVAIISKGDFEKSDFEESLPLGNTTLIN